jgi:hypothetical protein
MQLVVFGKDVTGLKLSGGPGRASAPQTAPSGRVGGQVGRQEVDDLAVADDADAADHGSESRIVLLLRADPVHCYRGPTTMTPLTAQTCQQLLSAFFAKYPNARLEDAAGRALGSLLACKAPLRGKPGGWAGGVVYAVSSIGVGVSGVLNAELEEAFGVSMDTIYRRAARIRDLLAP